MDGIEEVELEDAAEATLAAELQKLNIASGETESDSGHASEVKQVQFVRYRIAMDSVVRGTALNRSAKLQDLGMMVTTVGPRGVRGGFQKERGVVPAKSAKEAAKVENLRAEAKASMPGSLFLFLCFLFPFIFLTNILTGILAAWQAYEHAYLKGFLLPVVKAIEVSNVPLL